MSEIKVERKPERALLESKGVFSWSIWTKEVSTFPWSYDSAETCYFLEGDVIVTPEGGEPVRVGKGDLVTFPSGMSCTQGTGQETPPPVPTSSSRCSKPSGGGPGLSNVPGERFSACPRTM